MLDVSVIYIEKEVIVFHKRYFSFVSSTLSDLRCIAYLSDLEITRDLISFTYHPRALKTCSIATVDTGITIICLATFVKIEKYSCVSCLSF